MMSIVDSWGHLIPVTVLEVDRCQVIRHLTLEKNGYTAMEIGAGEKYLGNLRKSQIGHFLKAGIPPKLHIVQFRVSEENFLPIGFQFSSRHFTIGQFVDVKGVGKSKGFSGAMDRWGFAGQSASHGTCKTHRSLGSTGQCQDAGRVWKGKRMHGHLGGRSAMMRGLQIYKIDYERNLVYIRGSVPGRINDFVEITDSLHRSQENKLMLNHPTFVPKEGVKYANVVQMEASEQDPYEVYLHDEALPKDTDEE
jgi:large subunit ribosomal protein L3